MSWLLPGWFSVFWGYAVNVDARLLRFEFIPRPDLSSSWTTRLSALRIDFWWTYLDHMRGRKLPRVTVQSDVGEITTAVARACGALA